jgi:putative endonuclease
MSAQTKDAGRQRRYRSGLACEIVAAAYLTCRGYLVRARRFRTPMGEIDLIAVRRRTIAFVEVKRRADEMAAESALGERQRQRIRRAADAWVARNPRYRNYDRRFDLILVLPLRWPRHIPAGL